MNIGRVKIYAYLAILFVVLVALFKSVSSGGAIYSMLFVEFPWISLIAFEVLASAQTFRVILKFLKLGRLDRKYSVYIFVFNIFLTVSMVAVIIAMSPCDFVFFALAARLVISGFFVHQIVSKVNSSNG